MAEHAGCANFVQAILFKCAANVNLPAIMTDT